MDGEDGSGGVGGGATAEVGRDGLVEVSPRAVFGLSEAKTARKLYDGVLQLLIAEAAAAPTTLDSA